MPGRLVHKADFERLLATRSRSRSAHFALHHVSDGPSVARPARAGVSPAQLSTASAQAVPQVVDNTSSEVEPGLGLSDVAAALRAPQGLWIGCVVPKRHARRSVTRSLLKRQIRASFDRHAARLAPGLWLVRLRAGFPVAQFPSAASTRLAAEARAELDRLLARAL